METIYHPRTKKDIERFVAKPSHGVLLTGVKGAGKEHIARVVVSKLLNASLGSLDKYPYVKAMDALQSKSNIADVRELKKFLGLKTTGKGDLRRFIFVLNAEHLSIEAQNAMLKFLEEPPDDTCIILTSGQAGKLRPTILSRVQSIRIRELSQNQVNEVVDDSKDAARLYNLSAGAPAIFASLMQQSGDSEESKYIHRAKDILQQKRHGRLAELDKIIKDDEFDIDMLLNSMYKLLLMKLRLLSSKKSYNKSSLRNLHKKTEKVLLTRKLIGQNVQPKLALTALFYEL